MPKFADSPYFLLKDFMAELVAIVDYDNDLKSKVVNGWQGTLYKNAMFSGGATYTSTANPYDEDPLAGIVTNDANIFQHDISPFPDDVDVPHNETQFNAFYSYSPTANYKLSFKDINGDDTEVGVMMRGLEKSVVVKGGSYLDLFAKIENYGFAPVRLRPYGTPDEDIYFKFDAVEVATIVPDETNTVVYNSDVPADEPYFDSDEVNYTRLNYTYDYEFAGGQWLESGTEIYIRKDSAFHDWLKKFAFDFYKGRDDVELVLRNYVNTDKLFIYFGKIYAAPKLNPTDPDKYHIVFEGLKEWIERALPVNNRKPNFMVFLDTYFDRVYSEGYQLLKDVWSLRDAMECDKKFLGYIPTFYGMPIQDSIPEYFAPNFREYARDLVQLMKRKGTYSSLYIIYDVICANNPNILSVYERWHPSDVEQYDTTPPYADYVGSVEFTSSDLTISGTNITTSGNIIYFDVPEEELLDGTSSTASLNNFIMSADFTILLNLTISVHGMPDRVLSNARMIVSDGTTDIFAIWVEGDNDPASEGFFKYQIFDGASQDGTGTSYSRTITPAALTSSRSFSVVYNISNRNLTITLGGSEGIGSLRSQILKSTLGKAWYIRFDTYVPFGAAGGSVDADFSMYYNGKVATLNTSDDIVVPVTACKDYIYTGLYGIQEPTDEDVDLYGYLIDPEQVEPSTQEAFYVDQNKELIIATDGLPVITSNVVLEGGSPKVDIHGHVYINRGTPTDELAPLVKALQFPYGAGRFWYLKSDTSTYPDATDPYQAGGGYTDAFLSPRPYDGSMLSPYYRVDLDLNVSALTRLKIMPKEMALNLYNNWETMRPVNRQAEYNFIYAPFTDLNGKAYSLYNAPDDWQSVSRSLKNVTFDVDNYIHLQRDAYATWTIIHNMGTTNVIVICYDDTFKKIVPDSIQIIDGNTVSVKFSANVIGVCLISRAFQSKPAQYVMTHGTNRKEIIVQIRNTDGYVHTPIEIEISSAHEREYFYLTGYEPNSTVIIKKGLAEGDTVTNEEGEQEVMTDSDIWTFPTPSTTWEILHPYAGNAVMVSCYDANNRYIEPESVDFDQIDIDGYPKIVINWGQTPVSGFAAIDDVGDVISFYGIIPKSLNGTMLPVQWRLIIENDTDIYTPFPKGHLDNRRFANSPKTVHYETYIYGTVNQCEEDNEYYYYTFTVTDEALYHAGIGIKDYEITGVELLNTRIKRADKRRIVYSELSGIYKPFRVNFVCHYRIAKDAVSPLYDDSGYIMTDDIDAILLG